MTSRGSILLAATNDLRDLQSLVSVALGGKAILDRAVQALAIEWAGRREPGEGWVEIALGVLSLRRTLEGALAIEGEPPSRASREPLPRDLLR